MIQTFTPTSPIWTPSQVERRALAERGRTVVASHVGTVDSALIAWAKQTGKYVYIGRYFPGIGSSKWHNRFRIGPDGDRDAVCDAYVPYLAQKPALLAELPTLRAKVLACWCHPERCHGDHLAALANAEAGP